jgi:putative thioredoxin
MGAIPESEIRNFLNHHLPRASDGLLRQAESLLAQGKIVQAAELAERVRVSESDNTRATLILAKVKLVLKDFETAQTILDGLPMQEYNCVEAKTLRARLTFERIAAHAPEKIVLEKNLANEPNNSQTRYQLAALQVVTGEYQAALDNLLILLRKDRNYGEDAARKAMLLIFDLLGSSGELVNRYRTKLTNALF